jgi:O-antigen/teichoic acid export membrane protein
MRAHGDDGLAVSLRRAVEQMVGYNLPLCLVVMGAFPWVLVTLFGRAFQPGRPVLVTLAIAYALTGPAGIVGAAMIGRGQVWGAGILNALYAVGAIAAFLGGLDRFGATGAGASVAIGYAAMAVVCFGVVIPRWRFPWRGFATPLGVTVVCLAVCGTLALAPEVPEIVTAAVSFVLAAVVFVRWGWRTRAASGGVTT